MNLRTPEAARDPESVLSELAAISRRELVAVDVSDRVMQTITGFAVTTAPLDKTPLVLGGGLIAIAASVMLMMSPSLITISQPWVRFWLLS